MSDQGEPREQALPYPPPPPPPSSQPSSQQPWQTPPPAAFAGYPMAGTADVDPRSAGLERRERPGWALLFLAWGAIPMVAALFLDKWAEVRIFDLDSRGASPYREREFPGLFEAVDTVADVRSTDAFANDPGPLAELFFPWLAVALTVLCVVVAAAAAIGLRRFALTTAARVAGAVLGLVAAAVAVAAVVSLGFELSDDGGSGPATSSPAPATPGGPAPAPEEPDDDGDSTVEPGELGLPIWVGGALTLAVASVVGPRIKHVLPADAAPPRFAGPSGGSYPGPPGPGFAPGLLRHRTHVGAVVVAGIGAALCLAGYTFLSWTTVGETVTFIEIGDDVRDAGGSGNGYAEAYFSFVGWLVLLAALVVVLLVCLGLKPAGVNPRALRPVLLIGSFALLLSHLGALVDLDLPEYGPAAWVIGIGLAAIGVAAMLPLRTTARVALPHHPQPHQPWQGPTGS